VFKADSLAWHVGAALLVVALARRLLPEGQRRFAVVAGLVLALHPVTTETVDNASFREDGLVTFWGLAVLLLALSGRARAALGAYALALLSKESAVVIPVLLAGARLVADDQPPARRSARGIARELAPYAAVTAVYLVIRFGPLRTPIAYAVYPGGSLGAALLGMPAVWAHYLRLLVAPWPLCADYSGYFRFGPQPLAPFALALILELGYVAAAVLAARRGQGLLAFGLAWFALALGPVSNFIPVPIPAAERFLYLPLAGIALGASAATAALAARLPPATARVAAAAGVAVLVVFGALTDRRHASWRDDQTLWLETASRNPRSCGAQSAVGGNLLSRGIAEGAPDLLRQSIARQELALRLCADDDDVFRAAMTYTRLGAAHAMLNELDPARAALERAIALWPRYALPVAWLGYVRFLGGNSAEAAALLTRAVIELGPPDADVAEVASRYMEKI
jgi:tetratricopeptide (TPR) repeat protein